MSITQEHAICIFFNEDFTKENAEKLKEDLEKLFGLEICYTDDPLL
jgi:hypothetical protein